MPQAALATLFLLTAGAAAAEGGDQARCAAIATEAELTTFAGNAYAYTADPMGTPALLQCYYTTRTGPGSRVIRFGIEEDRDGSKYKFGQQLAEKSEPVSGLGERAYRTSGRALAMDGSTYTTIGLSAWRGGKLYSISSDQHQSEKATRDKQQEIVKRLLAVK
jgi:hypothetical protein